MSKLTLSEAIKHCLDIADGQDKCADISVSEHAKERIRECATEHRQLAEWLTELKELREKVSDGDVLRICQLEEREKEYKRLLKAAVEDFAKLDRENTKNKNCMMPEMNCADCPLSWDSVDDRVEPCHSWQYANEVLTLIGGENDERPSENKG